MVTRAQMRIRRYEGRFHGFRANCEQVPMLPAWAVRWIWDAPRHIPYLLAWKSRRDDKVKEAVRVMRVVPSPGVTEAPSVEVKGSDGSIVPVYLVWRWQPHGARSLLLRCLSFLRPCRARALYGARVGDDGRFYVVRRSDWQCRTCAKLSYSSEGGALIVRTRCATLSRCQACSHGRAQGSGFHACSRPPKVLRRLEFVYGLELRPCHEVPFVRLPLLSGMCITSQLPVTREQAGSLNAGTCITILPEVPHLDQQAIPRAAIPNCTNHFSVVNTLRESRFDSACSIEGFQLFGGEFQIQTGEIVLELRYLPRSYDRDYRHRLVAQPRERDLRHAATGLFGDRLHSRDDRYRSLFLRKEVLHSLIGHPPSVGLTLTVILPGQHAPRQRRPSQNPQVQSFRHRNQFALDRPLNEAVLDLQPNELCPAAKLRKDICLGDPPGGSVGDAYVENLSRASEIVQSAHDFFHGGDPVPDVHPVQVDIVGLQSLQTGFHCLHHALAVIARRIWITAGRGVRVFRG